MSAWSRGWVRRTARTRLRYLAETANPGTRSRLSRRRRWFIVAVAALVGALGGVALAGPVAGVLGAGYACLAASTGCARLREREAASARAAAVDAVGGLAADLRAGLAPEAALAEAAPALRTTHGQAGWINEVGWINQATKPARSTEVTVARAEALVTAAWYVGERLGAPLAYLLDRVDGDLRAAERSRANLLAQTAGVQMTSWLLAALPVAGIALGYGMGGDPLRILLHSPLGAACAIGALMLQCTGLAWSSWLCRSAVEESV